MSLLTNSSPHEHGPQSLQALMLRVLLALVPGIAVYAWFITPAVLVQISLAIVTALVCEGIIIKMRSRPVAPIITDGSAVLTAVLLALAIPPLAPWWIIVLGTAFAIIFGKQLFGGIGYNPFNPAMLGYAMLLISFPLEMTDWNVVGLYTRIFTEVQVLDGVSGATPLDSLRTGLTVAGTLPEYALFENTWQGNWHWLSLAYIAGGTWLLWRRDIAWQIPLALIATVFIVSSIFWLIDAARYASPLFHLFSGATMLAAFFIATDPVSAATTPRGRLVYAAGIGIIICVIRNWGGYPDAVAFAVLLMNMAAPTIDHFTKPKVFGHKGGDQS